MKKQILKQTIIILCIGIVLITTYIKNQKSVKAQSFSIEIPSGYSYYMQSSFIRYIDVGMGQLSPSFPIRRATTNIWETANTSWAYWSMNLSDSDMNNYTYFIRAYTGQEVHGTIFDPVEIPVGGSIYIMGPNTHGSAYNGGYTYQIYRKLKNRAPSLSLDTPNNQILSEEENQNILNLTGTVIDQNSSDQITIKFTVDGLSGYQNKTLP
ncbi:hypothetical protein ACFSCX_06675 [Bacillus salitolerans]|uniref:Uncharacterized protein n=1 Tax=Bacillus salitolerans TaxID=1437434 RepID=A0ABW4LMI4_9BACI